MFGCPENKGNPKRRNICHKEENSSKNEISGTQLYNILLRFLINQTKHKMKTGKSTNPWEGKFPETTKVLHLQDFLANQTEKVKEKRENTLEMNLI